MKHFKEYSLVLLLVFQLNLIFAQSGWELSAARFDAKPNNESLLRITEYGMYSIGVKSRQGTALQLVNQMTGPGEVQGTAGEKDGRLDILLDEGLYKLRMFSAPDSAGPVELDVIPFQELHSPQIPLLLPGQVIETDLQDREQRSWWIEVKDSEQPLYLELQGRHLSQVILWKEGSWVENVRMFTRKVEYRNGQPVVSCVINTRLSPGYYRLTAYGGPGEKWAQEDGRYPLRLRYGLISLAQNSRISDAISSFGVNRYLIQGSADYFLLQALQKTGFKLKVQSLQENEDFYIYDRMAEITEKSSSPQALITRNYQSTKILVSVEGEPGQLIYLQTLYRNQGMAIRPPSNGQYWVSTVHSGFMSDNIDASGFLVDNYSDTRVIASDMPLLSGRQGWNRQFNLLDTVTLYFEVEQAGTYSLDLSGTEAKARLERFFTSTPKDYQVPDLKSGSSEWVLEKGIHILTVQPVKKGILKVVIRPRGLNLAKTTSSPKQGNIQLGVVRLEKNRTYTLYSGQQGETVVGLQVRNLPLDLSEPLAVYLQPGEQVDIPFLVPVSSVLLVHGGGSYTLLSGGQTLTAGQTRLAAGRQSVQLKNTGSETTVFTLRLQSEETLPGAGPVYLPETVSEGFPRFDILEADKPVYFDLETTGNKVFMLQVKKPGIYRVQSLGLLRTRATMRDRITPSLGSAQENGTGRNFLLQSYLKEGIYQLQVEVVGKSAGHLGVWMEYLPPLEGGRLQPGIYQKSTVPAGQSLLYNLDVPREQIYTIRTIGMDREYPCRLEDSQGFPLLKPGIPTDIRQNLLPGSYLLVSLPQEVEGKRLTLLTVVSNNPDISGKGPLQLELNQTIRNTWKETASQREPDVYLFRIPARIPVNFSMETHMWGRLFRVEKGKKTALADLYADGRLDHTLPAGQYLLEVMARRKGNLQTYTVGISTQVLADGLYYTFSPARSFDVYLERDAQVEFFSTGKSDVSAELWDLGGQLIARVDDSTHDWNFLLSEGLKAGQYILKVENTRGSYGTTTVGMRVLKVIQEKPLVYGQALSINMAGDKKIFPLPTQGGAFHIRAQGGSGFYLSVIEKSQQQWLEKAIVTGQVYDWFYYLPPGSVYQLGLWSADHIDESIKLEIVPFKSQSVSMEDLQKGMTLTPAEGLVSLETRIEKHGYYRVICSEQSTGKVIERILAARLSGGSDPVYWDRVKDGHISLRPGKFNLTIPAENPVRIQLVEVRLAMGSEWGLTLHNKSRYYIHLEKGRADLHLLFVQGSQGQPVAAFTSSQGQFRLDEATALSEAFAFRQGTALALSTGDDLYAALWNPVSGPDAVPVRALYMGFSRPEPQVLSGPVQGTLQQGEIRSWAAQTQGQRQVVLEPGMLLFTWEGRQIKQVYYTQSEAEVFWVDGRLGLSIAVYKAEKAGFTVRPVMVSLTGRIKNVLLEASLTRSAWNVKEFTVNQAGRMLMATPGTRLWVLSSQGRLDTTEGGKGLSLEPGYYRVSIESPPGISRVWLSDQDQPAAGAWGEFPPGQVVKLSFPGDLVVEDSVWLQLPLKNDSVLHIQSGGPLLAALRTDKQIIRTDLLHPDVPEYYVIPAGTSLVGLRSLEEGPSPKVSLYWDSVYDLERALSNKYVLSEQGMLAFRFSLAAEQEVALGYAADSDLIDCVLLDSQGRRVLQGPVLFTTLAAGTYTILYRLQPQVPTAGFQPIYVNTSSIEQQVIQDQIRNFLKKYGYLKGKD